MNYGRYEIITKATDLVSYGIEKGSLLQPFTNSKLYVHQKCVENLQKVKCSTTKISGLLIIIA